MKVKFKAIGTDRLSDQPEYELPGGSTLQDLMRVLADRYGKDAIAGLVSVNSRLVYQDEAPSTVLKDGDEILVAPPISGG